MGLQALSVALEDGVMPPRPALFRLPGLPSILQELYAAAEFADIATLPWACATPDKKFAGAAGFDPEIDLRDFAFDPEFRGRAMIDFFLERLGAASVAPGRRRNTWLAPRIRPAVSGQPGYVLLCPKASMRLRDMPEPVAAAAATWLEQNTGRTIMRQTHVASLAELCGQVAGAGLVVSTDTGMVHLADAFEKPCIAFFTTHRPEWRMRDYPLCRAIHLPVPSLPPALEFSRGEADLAAVRAAWFPAGHDLSWLDAALARTLARTLPGALAG